MLIKQNQKVEIDIGPEKVKMYECTGTVHSIFDFTSQHIQLLTEIEVELLNKYLPFLKKRDDVPAYLNTCLSRSSDLQTGGTILEIKRNGARSALWEEKAIKFKGCRPLRNHSVTFPMEKLEFGTQEIKYSQIPFGVLSIESVLREILAFCFFMNSNLPIVHEPLCIYEYVDNDKTIGFCIVFKTKGEDRIEKFIEYPELSLNELIEIKKNRVGSKYLIGSELPLKRINVNRYSDKKAQLLSHMHFSGGFRGILNSNIGNDVVLNLGDLNLALCDFDTFMLVEMPQNPDIDFLNGFILFCVIEVLKGSISILDFVHFRNELSITERNKILFEKYKQTSSLWRAYERYFWLKVEEMKWDKQTVKNAFDNILNMEALFKILSLVIPNNVAIPEMVENRNIYYSHD